MAPLLSAQPLTNQQVTAWEEDIDVMLSKLWQTYPEADDQLDRAQIEQAAEELKAGLSRLSHEEVIIRLQALLALTGEGSNSIYAFQGKLLYDMLPLKAYWFADGLYVCDAAAPYEELVGQQIKRVNKVLVDSLWAHLKELLPGDNDQQKRGAATYYWQIAPWLAYLTGTEMGADVTLTLDKGELQVPFRPYTEYLALNRGLPSYRGLQASGSSYAEENYWMEYLAEQRTLFVQFLAIRDNANGPNFKAFVQQIEQRLTSGTVDKVVIDNRYGGGGNGFKLKPLTNLLRENEQINQRGKLFVLTGRGTRGTVQELTSILELNTKAILVGEPTGEGPNSVGDIKVVSLPNSGIDVLLVHTFWPTSWPEDSRMTISPEIGLDYAWSDFAAKVDPWLEAALAYTEEPVAPANVSWRPKTGKYTSGKYTVTIEEDNGRLYLNLKRKMKSFFELHTELHPAAGDRYNTDITDVFLERAATGGESLLLQWKGVSIELMP